MSVPVEIDRETFAQTYDAGESQLVWMRLANDVETPVSAMLKLAQGERDAFLLESVERGNWRGRFSVIGFDPDLKWRVIDGVAQIARDADIASDDFTDQDAAPFASLRAVLDETALNAPEGLPPMAAGLFGYLGYDMVAFIEKIDLSKPKPVDAPDALLVRPRIVVIFDALKQEIMFSTAVRVQTGLSADEAYDAACARLQAAADKLTRTAPAAPRGASTPGADIAIEETVAHEDFRAAVERAKTYIRAGDAFQVVPSQRFQAKLDASPFAFYRALRRLNPSPFLFYFKFDDLAVVGSSPEILTRVRGRTVTSRPIAGTRPRGRDEEHDVALERELLADPKERAEHLMLIDLARNDVGRIAEAGSVVVTEQFVIERYSHVMHIVSNIEGRLEADKTALDALMAGFPHGTVSGAPKVRAMEIIAEIEPERRGVYAGGAGYFSAAGDMDFCICLRTAVIKDDVMHVRAGAGVVFDSDAESERKECLHKAQALFRAAAEAKRFE